MRCCALIALLGCSSSTPPATKPTPEPTLEEAPVPVKPAALSNVGPAPSPPVSPTSAPAVLRSCTRSSPSVSTVTEDQRTHDQLCAIVGDYISFLGAPALRAPDLAFQLTVTVSDAACKVATEVRLRTKVAMNVEGEAALALGAIEVAREECIRALVNDQLGREIAPALTRAGVTGQASREATP